MDFANTDASWTKISRMCIGLQLILDSYLSLFHLNIALAFNSQFKAFTFLSFLGFVLFSIFEDRFLFSIWRVRRSDRFSENPYRQKYILYGQLFFGMMAGVFLFANFPGGFKFIVTFFYSFWLFQIIRNIRLDSRESLTPIYFFGTSLCRLVFPLYFLWNSSNFLRIRPAPGFGIFLLFYVMIQSIVIYLQDKFGSRFFIPKKFLPQKYNYFQQRELSDNFCVICRCEIEDDYMITPCNHFFHRTCLQRWMELKLECPTCRSPLPPP
ncbi:dsc e3 ubiquitin ligase complex subunit 1 [Anaeramoeba ignava]|uniref:RING-type E3 ubiquitin transferase n=1 Tax=Anaeramoeba ignava TaxID=1746090 RepID=A0A9Q0LF96_ANAIG|nr:dsc e3 ubiquitin ligase complex subunit 1 [Anaeramoeba ignava]